MRQPTDKRTAEAWWRAALDGEWIGDIADPRVFKYTAPGEWVPRDTSGYLFDFPQHGYFKFKRVRNGPWVPVKIMICCEVDDRGELVTDEWLEAQVGDKEIAVDFNFCLDIWIFAMSNPITADEYQYLMAARRWDMVYAPEHPYANPTQPVDHLKTPTAF